MCNSTKIIIAHITLYNIISTIVKPTNTTLILIATNTKEGQNFVCYNKI